MRRPRHQLPRLHRDERSGLELDRILVVDVVRDVNLVLEECTTTIEVKLSSDLRRVLSGPPTLVSMSFSFQTSVVWLGTTGGLLLFSLVSCTVAFLDLSVDLSFGMRGRLGRGDRVWLMTRMSGWVKV